MESQLRIVCDGDVNARYPRPALSQPGASPIVVAVREISTGETTRIQAADGEDAQGACLFPSVSHNGAVVGLDCEAYLAGDGSVVDGETIFSLPFVVWLQP